MGFPESPIQKGLTYPHKIPLWLRNQLSFEELNSYADYILSVFNVGTNIFDHEWEICIILDACRADLFEEFAPRHRVYNRFVDVSRVYSLASVTYEWIPRTIQGASSDVCGRTAYVTSVGFSKDIDDGVFGTKEEIWRYSVDPDAHVVHPKAVTDRAIELYRKAEFEKYLIHYTPPHAPFFHCIGKYDSRGDHPGGTQNVWTELSEGNFDREEVWSDYGENLLFVLDYVETLLDNTNGKVVITSDHGNALGEYGLYGHPQGTVVPPVRLVPWAEAVGSCDGTYSVKGKDTFRNVESDISPEENLEALGYK